MSAELDPLAMLSEKAVAAPRSISAYERRTRLEMRSTMLNLLGTIVTENEDPDRSTDIELVSLPVPLHIGETPFEQRVKVYRLNERFVGGIDKFVLVSGLYLEREGSVDERPLITVSSVAYMRGGLSAGKNTVIRNYQSRIATNQQVREGLHALESFRRQVQQLTPARRFTRL